MESYLLNKLRAMQSKSKSNELVVRAAYINSSITRGLSGRRSLI